ncbi:MAG: hypothetical protein ABF665_03200, partial [Gluconacetobacter sp.]
MDSTLHSHDMSATQDRRDDPAGGHDARPGAAGGRAQPLARNPGMEVPHVQAGPDWTKQRGDL